MAARHLVMGAVGVAALAALLQIVGVATPYWLKGGDAANVGLWRICGTASGGSVCIDLGSDVDDWLKATRAFGVIALLMMGAAFALGIILFIKPDLGMLMKVAALLCIIAAVCSIIAVGIFGGKYESTYGNNSVLKLNYSFGLCIAAAILSGAAGGLFVFAGKRE